MAYCSAVLDPPMEHIIHANLEDLIINKTRILSTCEILEGNLHFWLCKLRSACFLLFPTAIRSPTFWFLWLREVIFPYQTKIAVSPAA